MHGVRKTLIAEGYARPRDILLRCLRELAKGRDRKRQWTHSTLVASKTGLDQLTDDEIQGIAMSINLTPRKCLGFKSPVEAFLSELGKDIKICFNANVALRA